jgi:hypothetical protein
MYTMQWEGTWGLWRGMLPHVGATYVKVRYIAANTRKHINTKELVIKYQNSYYMVITKKKLINKNILYFQISYIILRMF